MKQAVRRGIRGLLRRNGAMAADGWNYRRAYFQDFDGKYYSVTISVAKGANGNMVYNIGNMKEEASPKVKGSSAGNGNGPRGFASSETSIRSSERKSQEKFSAAEAAVQHIRPVQSSSPGKRRSIASSAADCSARFLLLPVPLPTGFPLSSTSTSKCLSWSGPDSPISS